MYERTNGWTNGRRNDRTDEWTCEWPYGRTDEWMYEGTNKRTFAQTFARTLICSCVILQVNVQWNINPTNQNVRCGLLGSLVTHCQKKKTFFFYVDWFCRVFFPFDFGLVLTQNKKTKTGIPDSPHLQKKKNTLLQLPSTPSYSLCVLLRTIPGTQAQAHASHADRRHIWWWPRKCLLPVHPQTTKPKHNGNRNKTQPRWSYKQPGHHLQPQKRYAFLPSSPARR